jgi:hypothetical protein
MKEKRTAELVAAIVANVVAIVFVNSVPLWRQWTLGVILESWTGILWAANLSLVVEIAGNLLLIFYRPPRFYALVQAAFAAVSVVSIIVFYLVFPLDFSGLVGTWLNSLMRAILVIAAAATAIGLVVHLVRAVLGTPYASTGSA